MDITSIRLGKRFIYLAVIPDACTRAVRGWALSRWLEQELTLAALGMALSKAVPFIFHSDQGVQYAAFAHIELLLRAQVKLSMSDKASPTLVERFMPTVKEEQVDFADYQDFADAFRQLKPWLEVEYMTERVHPALHYQSPAEFEALALAGLNPLFSSG